MGEREEPLRSEIAEVARKLARIHLEQANAEGTGVDVNSDMLIDKEAARILDGVAKDILTEWD